MRRLLFAFAVLSLVASPLVPQSLVVYVDGDPSLVIGDQIDQLVIGAEIGPDAIIRLQRGDYVELQAGDRLVRLGREGEYAMTSLLRAARDHEGAGASRAIADRVSRVLGRAHEIPQTAAMGVRGPELDTDDPTINEAIALMDAGSYAEARDILVDHADELEDRRALPRVAFLIGSSAASAGDWRGAVEWLELFGPDPRTEFFVDHSIVLSHLLFEQFAYAEVALVLGDLRDLAPASQDDPDVTLLYGISLLESGEVDSARMILQSLEGTVHQSTAEKLIEPAAE